MSWAKFDDMLPSNRKWRRVVKRSPEAACLWVAAVCYSARYLTDGRVPKDEVDDLGPFRNPAKLAAVLVAESLFDDDGDAWAVHDYLDYNPSGREILANREKDRERKKEERKKGAANSTRGPDGQFVSGGTSDWTGDGQESGQSSDVQAESEDSSTAIVQSRPVPSRQSSSNSDSREPPDPPADDDGLGLDPDTAAAVDAAARARLALRVAEKGPVRHPESWLAADKRTTLVALKTGDRSRLTVGSPATNGHKLDPLSATAAARRAEIERNEARRRGESACLVCADAGVVELDDGTVVRCPACNP